MNIIIIYGGPNSGKTTEAKKLSKNKNTSHINYSDSNLPGLRLFMNGVDPGCELLIIDECPTNTDWLYLNEFKDGFSLHRKGKEDQWINPELILITTYQPQINLEKLPHVRMINMTREADSKHPEKKLEYETKCRRCGELEERHFSFSDQVTPLSFAKAMYDHIRDPRTHECSKCKKKTVQDVVAYTKYPIYQ